MKGFCPNCNIALGDKENIVLTKESKIFKGHNVYCMCKQCGYVMVYNKDRDLVFSLDRFSEDKEVVTEISELLNEATNAEVELVSKTEEKAEEKEEEIQLITEDEKAEQLGCGGCTGNCATCSGCSDQQALESIEKGDLLIINKKTGLISIAKPNMLDDLNIDDYEFYELSPVFVEKVVSYKITHL